MPSNTPYTLGQRAPQVFRLVENHFEINSLSGIQNKRTLYELESLEPCSVCSGNTRGIFQDQTSLEVSFLPFSLSPISFPQILEGDGIESRRDTEPGKGATESLCGAIRSHLGDSWVTELGAQAGEYQDGRGQELSSTHLARGLDPLPDAEVADDPGEQEAQCQLPAQGPGVLDAVGELQDPPPAERGLSWAFANTSVCSLRVRRWSHASV